MSRIMNIWNKVISENRSTGNVLKIAIHDGKFHLDEIMALVQLSMAGISFEVIRTRNPHLLDGCDLIIDVAGKNEGRVFDHHQRDFSMVRDNSVKYAACGLVWLDLQDHILNTICPDNEDVRNIVREKIQEILIVPTDAVDTGTTGPANPLTPPSLATVVGAYNSMDTSIQDTCFQQAYEVIREIVVRMVQNWIDAATEQVRIFDEMILQKDSDILVLSEGGPWIELAVSHWDEFSNFKVAIYPDVTHADQWRIQTFPGSKENTFEQRCSAPAHWKGLREGDNYGTSFDDKMVFCHPGGFIAGIRGSREDAINAADYWIANSSSNA